MHTVDWLIVAVPIVAVIGIALKAQRYVRGVADFLAAGRVAGRYVLAVSAGEASLGLISIAAMFESQYNSGFALAFWNQLFIPISMMLTLTGYCIYRFRETRAMTMGQFLEMRYNRSFRILAGCLQAFSGIMNYAIFPAVGARFLIYCCDLPLHIDVGAFSVPTFGIVMAAFLTLAVIIASMGGQITIMVTDCVQGILSYPLYAIVVIYLLLRFSYFDEMAPALLSRPPGESMVNPFDISKLRDFNLFYVVVTIVASTLGRMSWSGTQGYNAAALNAHEQKMGGVLGTWRSGFSFLMFTLLALVGFTFLNSPTYEQEALAVRRGLAAKTIEDVMPAHSGDNLAMGKEVGAYISTGELSPELTDRLDAAREDEALSNVRNEPVRDITKRIIALEEPVKAQTFGAIFGQMRLPYTLGRILPVGVLGAFCALCIFLLVSTDTTYLHSWGSIIVQDIVLPLRRKPLTPHQHLRLLRIVIALVAAFAFSFSFLFAQIDYVLMFFAITGAIWTGGAGICIVGGLYWKRATTPAAFTALITGSSIAVGGAVAQKTWVPFIYPWLEQGGRVDGVARVLEGISRPFEPYILWRVTPDKFPINSQEMLFIGMVLSVSLFVVVSWLTCREAFNMDRLLHRGKYRREGEEVIRGERLTWRTAIQKTIGINSEYSRGDKVLAWSAFVYGVVWTFGSFLVIVIWNSVTPWPNHWWTHWLAINGIYVAGLIGVVSTVWFTIGGTMDLRRLFRRLRDHQSSMLDDGRVVGHVSADDVALVEEVEHVTMAEAHREEHELEAAIEREHEVGRDHK